MFISRRIEYLQICKFKISRKKDGMRRTEVSLYNLTLCHGNLTPRALTFRLSTMSKLQVLSWTQMWNLAKVKGAKLSQAAPVTLAWCTVRKLLNMRYDSKPNGVGRTRQQQRAIPAHCLELLSNRYLHHRQMIHHLRLIMYSTSILVIIIP